MGGHLPIILQYPLAINTLLFQMKHIHLPVQQFYLFAFLFWTVFHNFFNICKTLIQGMRKEQEGLQYPQIIQR